MKRPPEHVIAALARVEVTKEDLDAAVREGRKLREAFERDVIEKMRRLTSADLGALCK